MVKVRKMALREGWRTYMLIRMVNLAFTYLDERESYVSKRILRDKLIYSTL